MIETIPKTSIDDAAKFLKKAGFSDQFIRRFVSEAKVQHQLKPVGPSIEDAFRLVSNESPRAGITPNVIKDFKFAHPTLWYGGIIVVGYLLSVLTVFLGFFSLIPSVGLGIYLATKDRTRFHGVAIIVIGFILIL
jgi:hypothetical protein